MKLLCESDRLFLRELEITDAAFVLELVNEPAFIEFISDKKIRTIDQARTFVRNGPWTNQDRDGFGQYAIQTKICGTTVGVCGLLERKDHGLIDVGFALLARHWGNGYALEAARAVCAYGRKELRLEQIGGVVSPGNHASIRILEKLGMKANREIMLGGDLCLVYL